MLTSNEMVNDRALAVQLETEEETNRLGLYAQRSLEGENVTAEIMASSFR
jgi:hypothetical protein